MRKRKISWTLFVTVFAWLTSCSDDIQTSGSKFDPNQPIEVEEFYPDSGGIATPMIVEGRNFGTDTTGMRVYFEDVDGMKHPAGLVSSNGQKIYLFVPSGLTFKREMNLIVERTMPDGKVYSNKAPDLFIYRTQTSVSTIVGQASPDNDNLKTVGGNLTTSTLSAPAYICLDAEENVFISERSFSGGNHTPYLACRNDKGESVAGNIVMASLKSDAVVAMKYGAINMNAPAYSNEEDNESVYIPDDAGTGFYNMIKALGYAPRYLTMIKSPETADIDNGNWKHSFVVNKNDHQIYTVMWKGQLVRINPKTKTAEIILKKIATENSGGGSDAYISFSPVKSLENMLYVCLADYNQIWRVDIGALEGKDKDTYPGEPYAGKAITEGKEAGRGWEDGLLRNAKFNAPRQICFTDEGKLYIADCANHCIRVIDTTLPQDKTTVTTPIGLPGAAGYKDGGPEIAKFNWPTGVAVSSDGRIVYVADAKNKVIRKLSIE